MKKLPPPRGRGKAYTVNPNLRREGASDGRRTHREDDHGPDAARQEYHYHQHDYAVPPVPPPVSPPPRKNERLGMLIVFGLVALVILVAIIGSRNPGDDAAAEETPAVAADAPDERQAQATADDLQEAAIRDELQEEYKSKAIALMQYDQGDPSGEYLLSDAVDGNTTCSGPKMWGFEQPAGTAPMEADLPLQGTFMYIDFEGGKTSKGVYNWDGKRLATKTVTLGGFDPASVDTIGADATLRQVVFHEVKEQWQGLPLRHIDTVSNRHTYDRFVIGRKAYMLCHLAGGGA